MALTRVLITVKTYPAISAKYDELVCTAGFLENGKWIRIYPIPFRKKPYPQQYKKYDWIEVDLVKNESDFRPESFRPKTLETPITIIGRIDSKPTWLPRRELVLGKVFTDMNELIALSKEKSSYTSLAVFKPTKIIDFIADPVEREWGASKLARLQQLNIFEVVTENRFQVVKKLPYKFSYVFEDVHGKKRTLMIEDWEIGALFWRMLAKHEGDEFKALQDVKKKYLDDFARTKDLHFFLGTTQAHHLQARNPFIIIGTFHPPKEKQGRLF